MSNTAAAADMDARPEDLYAESSPGERAAEEPGESMAEGYQTGGAVDWSQTGSGGLPDRDSDGLEGALQRAKTLSEHLHEQLAVAGLDPADRAIAAVLIDGVDDGGYLRCDLVEAAERLGCDLQRVERVLGVLQGFEPTGVFARDVRECLALQLKEKDRLDPAMAALLDNLALLARRDMAGLSRACGVDDEDLKDMLAELRALTPRPGAAFGGDPAAPVIPDAIVREVGGRAVARGAERRHPAQASD